MSRRSMRREGSPMPAMGTAKHRSMHEESSIGEGNLTDHPDAMRYDNPRGYTGLEGIPLHRQGHDRNDCRHQTRHHMELGEDLVRGRMPLLKGGASVTARKEPQNDPRNKSGGSGKPPEPSHRPKVD
jgi:hypothetical protein